MSHDTVNAVGGPVPPTTLQQPVEPAPSIWWAILLGWLGALIVQVKKTNHHQSWAMAKYWIVGLVSTFAVLVATLIMPFVLLHAATSSLGSSATPGGTTSEQPTATPTHLLDPTSPIFDQHADPKKLAEAIETTRIYAIENGDVARLAAIFGGNTDAQGYSDDLALLKAGAASVNYQPGDIYNVSMQSGNVVHDITPVIINGQTLAFASDYSWDTSLQQWVVSSHIIIK